MPGPRRRSVIGSAVGALACAAGIGPARADAAFGPGEELVIATVGSGWIGDAVRNGAQLAIEQLNSEGGGILGHKVRLRAESLDAGTSNVRGAAVKLADRIMSEKNLIGVIGHDDVDDALPAAIAYRQRDIPLISPTITSTGLTIHGLKNVFATMPDNTGISVQTARIAFYIGLRRVVILRNRGGDALEISLAYRDEAATLGITLVEERSFPEGTSPRDFLDGMQGLRFDHFVIIGSVDMQVSMIKAAADSGLNVTCVLPNMFNVDLLRKRLGRVAPYVMLPVLRDHQGQSPTQVAWDNAYNARFGERPIDISMQGTDAVKLLAAGITRVNTFDLAELARVLHSELAYTGVSGRMSFRRDGRIYTRLLGFASIRPNDVAYYMPGA